MDPFISPELLQTILLIMGSSGLGGLGLGIYNAWIASRKGTVDEWRSLLEEQRKVIDGQKVIITDQNNVIKEQAKVNEDQKKKLLDLDKEIVHRDQRIAQRDQMIAERDQRNAKLDETITDLKNWAERLVKQVQKFAPSGVEPERFEGNPMKQV